MAQNMHTNCACVRVRALARAIHCDRAYIHQEIILLRACGGEQLSTNYLVDVDLVFDATTYQRASHGYCVKHLCAGNVFPRPCQR